MIVIIEHLLVWFLQKGNVGEIVDLLQDATLCDSGETTSQDCLQQSVRSDSHDVEWKQSL